MLSFDSEDDDSDGDDGGRRRKSKVTSSGEDDEDARLTFDDHIDRILRKTRTIALLKIANNTADVLPEDASFVYDSDGDEDGDFADDDSFETIDDEFVGSAAKSTSPLQSSAARGSFRRNGSMRSSASGSHSSSSHKISHEESAAAIRLVRTLSSFLSLPRVISYKDLEMVRRLSSGASPLDAALIVPSLTRCRRCHRQITEKLLDEPSDTHDDYGDLIDFHVDSARDAANAGDDAGADDLPLWKRRNTVS